MPIFSSGSDVTPAPKIAHRLRSADRRGKWRGHVSKVAITASAMVFTTAPLSDAIIYCSSLKAVDEIEGGEVTDRS